MVWGQASAILSVKWDCNSSSEAQISLAFVFAGTGTLYMRLTWIVREKIQLQTVWGMLLLILHFAIENYEVSFCIILFLLVIFFLILDFSLTCWCLLKWKIKRPDIFPNCINSELLNSCILWKTYLLNFFIFYIQFWGIL